MNAEAGPDHTDQLKVADIVKLFDQVESPSISGHAVCGACNHEWIAVAPAKTTLLDCPKCKRGWGAFKHQVEPEIAWRCNCGEQLFWLTPTGAMCRRCGNRSNDWAN